MKTRIEDLTNEQLNEWVALAQGWCLLKESPDDVRKPEEIWTDSKGAMKDYKWRYTPATSPAQWAELMVAYFIDIEGFFDDENNRKVKATCFNNEYLDGVEVEPGSVETGHACADSVGVATCRAVVASAYGDEVEVEW